jgi:hypothetical protein
MRGEPLLNIDISPLKLDQIKSLNENEVDKGKEKKEDNKNNLLNEKHEDEQGLSYKSDEGMNSTRSCLDEEMVNVGKAEEEEIGESYRTVADMENINNELTDFLAPQQGIQGGDAHFNNLNGKLKPNTIIPSKKSPQDSLIALEKTPNNSNNNNNNNNNIENINSIMEKREPEQISLAKKEEEKEVDYKIMSVSLKKEDGDKKLDKKKENENKIGIDKNDYGKDAGRVKKYRSNTDAGKNKKEDNIFKDDKRLKFE